MKATYLQCGGGQSLGLALFPHVAFYESHPFCKNKSCKQEILPWTKDVSHWWHSHHNPRLSSFMKWKSHLVLTAAGPIHRPVQLWVACCPHSAPQSAAYILGEQRERLMSYLHSAVCIPNKVFAFITLYVIQYTSRDVAWKCCSPTQIWKQAFCVIYCIDYTFWITNKNNTV